jgi:arylsulfatase A-like enzyme/Flp pilus assembly protein TadD
MKRPSGLLLALLLALPAVASPAPARRPNVLLVTIDTLRPDRLSCYSQRYLQTPNIDRVAAGGVVFTRAFAHSPMTLPSHANILLGTTPLQHGVHDNGIFRVPENLPNLATYLKQSGYATGAVVGAFPLDSRFGLDRGFDLYDDYYGAGPFIENQFVERKADAVVDNALAWLRGTAEPWFLWVHLFDPHQPYEPPEPYATKFKDDPYSGESAYVDSALARLFGHLGDSGGADSTVVVITGDHGQALGEHGEATHGYFAYNSALWVPLIVAGPGVKPGRVDQNVCHVDIFPTVCDLVGLPKPPYLQGVSLVPAIRGKEIPARAIYFESLDPYYRAGWAPLRGFIEARRKFIDQPIPELYDLGSDFNETKNLAGPDVEKDRAALAKLVKAGTAAGSAAAAKPKLDAEAQRKLQSLGYVGGYQPSAKESFGPQDDLKTLLPFIARFEEAEGTYYLGEAAKSIGLLRDLIRDRPDYAEPYTFLMTIYEKQELTAEAEAVLRKGAADNPRNYKLVLQHGGLLAELGRNDEAIGVLMKAAALIDWDPELWNYLGLAYMNKGDLDQAKTAYDRARSLDPKYAPVLCNLGTVHWTLARKNKDQAALEKALDYYKQALEADPNYAAAYNGLGAVYRLTGDRDAAIFCWGEAVRLDPTHKFALYNLGVAYLEKGDKANALTYLKRYKDRYYKVLSASEKSALDADIAKCRKTP